MKALIATTFGFMALALTQCHASMLIFTFSGVIDSVEFVNLPGQYNPFQVGDPWSAFIQVDQRTGIKRGNTTTYYVVPFSVAPGDTGEDGATVGDSFLYGGLGYIEITHYWNGFGIHYSSDFPADPFTNTDGNVDFTYSRIGSVVTNDFNAVGLSWFGIEDYYTREYAHGTSTGNIQSIPDSSTTLGLLALALCVTVCMKRYA